MSSEIELTSSINGTHQKVPVRLCLITEPVEQESDRLGSIDFWFGFVRLTTSGLYKDASQRWGTEQGYLRCSADITNSHQYASIREVSAECR